MTSAVAYLLLTRGEAGIDALSPGQTAALRTREQLAAASAVGVSRVDFLDYPDGVLEYGLDLRRDIAATIRKFQPDVVLVGSWEVEFVAGLNQADHRVAGLATLDSIRDAANRWVFPEQVADGLAPWSVRWVLVAGHPLPTHGVDVTGESLERGVAALEAHAEYLAGIPGHPPAHVVVESIAAIQGRVLGVPSAVLFRAFDLQAPPIVLGGRATPSGESANDPSVHTHLQGGGV